MNADHSQNTSELQALEGHLASLRPRAEQTDRDRLMYEAGRQSVLRERCYTPWMWSATSAGLATAATLLALVTLRPDPPAVTTMHNFSAKELSDSHEAPDSKVAHVEKEPAPVAESKAPEYLARALPGILRTSGVHAESDRLIRELLASPALVSSEEPWRAPISSGVEQQQATADTSAARNQLRELLLQELPPSA